MLNSTHFLYSNGSSTTYGLDLIKPKGTNGTFESYRIENSYSGLLAQNFNIPEYVNAAKPGSCIESVCRRTIYDLSAICDTQKRSPETVFALIALPPATPTEIYLKNEKKYVNIMLPEPHILKFKGDLESGVHAYFYEAQTQFHKLLCDQILNFQYVMDKYFTSLIGMISYLTSRNFKFLIFNTTPILFCEIQEQTGELNPFKLGELERNKFIINSYLTENRISNLFESQNLLQFNKSSTYEHCIVQGQCQLGKTGHILEEGHKMWAEQLIHAIS